MSTTLIIGFSLVTLLVYKVLECVSRNNLTKIGKIKFFISASLIVAYIATGYLLDYPDSLYWFIFIAVIILSFSVSSKLVRSEFQRYLALNKKDKVINVFYYTLILTSITIIF